MMVSAKPIAAFALARACTESVWVFDTVDQLAAAISIRCAGRCHHVASACLFGPVETSEAAIAVYALDDRGERVAFAGYALGLGHDTETLLSAIARAEAARMRTARTTQPEKAA